MDRDILRDEEAVKAVGEEVFTIIGLLADREYETVEYMTGRHVSAEYLAETVERCRVNILPMTMSDLEEVAIRETHRRRLLIGPFRRQRRRFSAIAHVPMERASDPGLLLALTVWVEYDGLTESKIDKFSIT